MLCPRGGNSLKRFAIAETTFGSNSFPPLRCLLPVFPQSQLSDKNKENCDKLDRVNCARLRRPYGGLGGSLEVMGEWSVSQWILGVMRFQKISGLYIVELLKVEKWSG